MRHSVEPKDRIYVRRYGFLSFAKAEVTGDLIGTKISHKITSASKKSLRKLQSQNQDEIYIRKEKYISPEKRQQIIDESILV